MVQNWSFCILFLKRRQSTVLPKLPVRYDKSGTRYRYRYHFRGQLAKASAPVPLLGINQRSKKSGQPTKVSALYRQLAYQRTFFCQMYKNR